MQHELCNPPQIFQATISQLDLQHKSTPVCSEVNSRTFNRSILAQSNQTFIFGLPRWALFFLLSFPPPPPHLNCKGVILHPKKFPPTFCSCLPALADAPVQNARRTLSYFLMWLNPCKNYFFARCPFMIGAKRSLQTIKGNSIFPGRTGKKEKKSVT